MKAVVVPLALICLLAAPAAAGPYGRPPGGKAPIRGAPGTPTHSPPPPVGPRIGPGSPGHSPLRPVPLRRPFENEDDRTLERRRRDADRRLREADAGIDERGRRIRGLYDDREYLERVPEERARYIHDEIDRDIAEEDIDGYLQDWIADLGDEIDDLRRGRGQAETERRDADAEIARRRALREVGGGVHNVGERAGDVAEEAAAAAEGPLDVPQLPRDPETGRPVVNMPLGD